MSETTSLGEKLNAVYGIATFRPVQTVGLIILAVFAAVLEGIGLSFLLPIVNQSQQTTSDPSGLMAAFATVYDFFGLAFTLRNIVIGVSVVMVARYTSSFVVAWLKVAIETNYIRMLQTRSFESALDCRISYFDQEGSDDILNAIVTQAAQAGRNISHLVKLIEQGLLTAMYLSIALYIAPMLTIASAVVLGGLTLLVRRVLEPGYAVGDRVADANEQVQSSVQAGTQGIRDVKLFGLHDELFSEFENAVRQYADSSIVIGRNKAAITDFYQMSTAIVVFLLIYFALSSTTLSLGEIGVFLFSMFRLAPRVSTLNNVVYSLESQLPHLVRTQQFISELEQQAEPDTDGAELPDHIIRVAFDNVSFAYDDELVLNRVSFDIERGEFVAFVGPSGAGKSTIVSLLARLYEPNSGEITANGTPIDQFDLEEWRSRVAVVRQDPFVFNETLRYNITLGSRDVSKAAIERICDIAQVSEFMSELPDGLDTVLGDDGVRLSGGQRQRVSIARALLKDADILILDEATSDLDSTLESQVQAAIEEMDRECAMLVIAHRLSTIRNADRIYTMEEGRVTEVGTHDKLLGEGGSYAELYDVQTQHS